MADPDETNNLLREIRDLLADQERKYQQHLVDIKAIYAEQLKMGEKARQKSVWILLAAIVVVIVGVVALVMP